MIRKLVIGVLSLGALTLSPCPVALADQPPVFVSEWGGPGTGGDNFRFLWGGTAGLSDLIFTVDAEYARVQKFDADGNYLTMWGDSSVFFSPTELGIDSRDFIYVIDAGGYVRVFAPALFSDGFEAGDTSAWLNSVP